MLKLNKDTKGDLIALYKTKGIFLEGNILKVIDHENDQEFSKYLKEASEKDADNRKKRLEITKQVQNQNKELIDWKKKNEQNQIKLKQALEQPEKAKDGAINDLEIVQKKSQYELVGSIVKVSLWIICGVGVITTLMFALSLTLGVDNKIVESAWSNMFGILLTNCFSIIGTIMGVKYANGKSETQKCKCRDS